MPVSINKLSTIPNSLKATDSTIPQDIQSRVFEPFFTTKSISEGTGLGLFVSYSIIQNHSGTLTVRSQPGAENIFEITLLHEIR